MLKKLHCGLLKFLELDMHAFFHYFDKNSGSISRIDDGDDDDDFGANNDEETAQEREIREDTERDQARILERI